MRCTGPVDGLVFDQVARLYDRARPTYPAAVFDDVARTADLAPGARIVEVGPGTGQATRSLAERGWNVTAVEPGPRLAAIAAERFAFASNVSVVVSRFEDWNPSDATPYDAVFAATMWHWVDPERGYRKAASVLRPGGSLAVVETRHVLPRNGGDRFFAEMQNIYDEILAADPRGGPPDPDDVDEALATAIIESGWFEPPTVTRHLWSQTYTAAAYIDVIRTYSNHIAMTDAQRSRLFDAIRERVGRRSDPVINKHYLNIVYVAGRH